MADIQYLNYGDQQIEQQALLNNLANNVQNYVQNQSWSTKRKEKFMSAYLDLMNRGITGASNNTGQWTINVNGDPLPEMSKKDKEMYQEAAYFIQQQMASLPTKQAEEEKKEEEKAKLDLFNNQYFTTGFNTRLANDWFGGASFSRADDWNTLDERGENGLRGFKNRADRLAQSLQNYVDTLDESKLNFEGSAFKNLDDFKTKVGTAIQILRTDPANAKDALNAIGLKFSDYLYNGAEDVSGYQDKEGNPLTYQQVADIQQKTQEEADVLKAQEVAAVQQQQANANKGILNQIGGIHGTDARNNPQGYAEHISKNLGVGQQGFNAMNSLVQGLLDKAYSGGGLNSDEKKQLGNLLYYIRQNNPNYQGLGNGQKTNVTLEEFEELKKFQSFGENNIKNMVRLPWQTSDGRYTYADSKGNVYFLRPTNQKKFNAPAINRSKEYYNYKNNFLKSQNNQALNTTIGDNGLTDDMKADLAAMGLDLVSAGAAFAPGYGTLASAVTGIGATLTGAAADRMRGESWGSTLGTAGFGLSMDILGLIPGVGVGAKAAKIAKVVAKGAKWIGPALGGLAAMSYGPGALSAYKKFTSGKKDDVTAEELRDFTYAIRAIAAGGIRKAGATYQGNRTLARAVKEGKAEISSGKQAASITTKNGQKIKLTDDEFKTLKSNASRETKTKTITEAAKREKINLEGDEIQWKGLNPAKGRFKTSSKSSKLSGLNEPTESSQLKWNTTSADYKGIRRFSNENLLRGFTTMSIPSSGIWRGIRNRWTGQDILNRPQTQSSTTSSTKESQKLLPFITKTESQEVIPISRALPQPGGTHKGNVIDNMRPGTINTNRITLGDANQEFNDFHRMYIASSNKNSKVISKPFGNGYGTSKEPENGSLSFNGITATLTKLDNNKGFSITFGKSGDTVIAKQYKDIQQLRNNFAKQLNKVIKKQSNVKETAALLRQFKAKGWLKQGGTIDKQRIQQYKEYITK